jgi:hypothetical protein
MKDMSSSLNQEMPSSSNQELVVILEHTTPIEHSESPMDNDNETHKRCKRQRTVESFCDDFIVYLVDDTPISILEAYASPNAGYWKVAICNEMDSILANRT